MPNSTAPQDLPRSCWVIGDIHGSLTQLRQLEASVRELCYTKSRPYFFSVGDLVDRGPAGFEVISYLKTQVETGAYTVTLGNHDEVFLSFLLKFLGRNDECPPLYKNTPLEILADFWLTDDMGGTKTLLSYPEGEKLVALQKTKIKDRALLEEHTRFLLSRPLIHEDEHFVITHALVSPESLRRLQDNPHSRNETLREECLWNRKFPKTPPLPGKKHLSGHTPVHHVRHYPAIGCSLVDTGCVYGGKLSAYNPQSDEVVEVDS